MNHLREWEWFRGGTTISTHTLLHQGHGKPLVGDAVAGVAHVFRLTTCHMEVDPKQNILKTLSSIIHEAQLEPLLVVEGLGQGTAESIRWQGRLMAVLKLGEQLLQEKQCNLVTMLLCP